MAKAVGIDLGTTTSSVAVFDGKRARLLVVDERERVMPTVVQHHPDTSAVTVGSFADRTSVTNPDFTYRGLKRLLGRRFNDPLVQEMSDNISYTLAFGPDGEAWVKTPAGQASPEELLAHVLRRLKDIAQTAMGEQVSFAVVGVPASFNDVQKFAVRRACAMAGLTVKKLVSEPTAAAVAYGLERGLGKTIAVYDLGGGTFDATILKVNDRRYRVLGVAGDAFLGGEDFDTRLVDWLSDRFKDRHGFDPRTDRLALQRLRLATEKAKIELSSVEEYRVFESRFAKDIQSHALLDLDETVSREQLEELVGDLIDRTRKPCLAAMAMAKVEPRDIDDVVLVGGMTRMPRVQEAAQELFGRAPAQTRINPVEAVTIGCAVLAAAIAGETRTVHLDDVIASNFGLEASGGAFVPFIRRGTRVPCTKTLRTGPEANAEAVIVRVFQGDGAIARDNVAIGAVIMDGLPKRRAGEVDIDVTMELDEDSILTVGLTDVESGRAVSKRFHAETGLDADDIAGLRGLGEDDEVGPEDLDGALDAPVEDPAATVTEEIASEPVGDNETEPFEVPEEITSATAEELDPPETPAPASAPDEALADAGPGEAAEEELPPMPGEPRWAKPEAVAAE